jgi:hypothetical protein
MLKPLKLAGKAAGAVRLSCESGVAFDSRVRQ